MYRERKGQTVIVSIIVPRRERKRKVAKYTGTRLGQLRVGWGKRHEKAATVLFRLVMDVGNGCRIEVTLTSKLEFGPDVAISIVFVRVRVCAEIPVQLCGDRSRH